MSDPRDINRDAKWRRLVMNEGPGGDIGEHILPLLGSLPLTRFDVETLDSFYAGRRRCCEHCDDEERPGSAVGHVPGAATGSAGRGTSTAVWSAVATPLPVGHP
jgi:hypothetical protein